MDLKCVGSRLYREGMGVVEMAKKLYVRTLLWEFAVLCEGVYVRVTVCFAHT